MSTKFVKDVNVHTFPAEVTAAAVPVLVDFTAAWCAPCRMIAPHLDAVAQAHPGTLRVVKVDVDENPELVARYDVRSMPTLMMFKGGQVVGQIIGAVPRARIEDLVARAGVAAAG